MRCLQSFAVFVQRYHVASFFELALQCSNVVGHPPAPIQVQTGQQLVVSQLVIPLGTGTKWSLWEIVGVIVAVILLESPCQWIRDASGQTCLCRAEAQLDPIPSRGISSCTHSHKWHSSTET
eukprot:TRINITY_DN68198_c4_g2_i1.p3 TRINITY_DN68198_c4_g2~~TRINITY_DN68198_c4_g2_i1.p3  ORF type:complete len:122 (-),score=2.96 TRINITY_DN68198_c4_g2_i1:145-510(-)